MKEIKIYTCKNLNTQCSMHLLKTDGFRDSKIVIVGVYHSFALYLFFRREFHVHSGHDKQDKPPFSFSFFLSSFFFF